LNAASERAEDFFVRERRSISPKAIAFAVLAVGSFVIGVITNSILIFVAIAIMAIYGIVLVVLQPAKPEITINRTLNVSKLYEQDVATVTLEVINNANTSFDLIQLKDQVAPEFLAPKERSSFSFSMRPFESKQFSYDISSKLFGLYFVGPITVSVSDPYGFVQFEALYGLHSSISVYPKFTERLSKLEPRPKRTKYWPGEIASRKAGTGSDFFSIRANIEGEPMRRVNWRASARVLNDQQKLMINEYMAELGAETMIVVDSRTIAFENAKEIFSSSIRAAISVADRLLKDKNRVGLFAISANSQRLSPRYGLRQYDRIIESLLLVRPGEDWAIGNLVKYVHFFYPHVSQVVFISPLRDEGSIRAVNELSRAHYDLFVISPNALEEPAYQRKNSSLRFRQTSDDRERRLAFDLAALERRSLIEQLRQNNAVVVDWNTSEPLEAALELNRHAVARRFEMGRL
jgi:uncharacterized protein (DUF58 family)